MNKLDAIKILMSHPLSVIKHGIRVQKYGIENRKEEYHKQ